MTGNGFLTPGDMLAVNRERHDHVARKVTSPQPQKTRAGPRGSPL